MKSLGEKVHIICLEGKTKYKYDKQVNTVFFLRAMDGIGGKEKKKKRNRI